QVGRQIERAAAAAEGCLALLKVREIGLKRGLKLGGRATQPGEAPCRVGRDHGQAMLAGKFLDQLEVLRMPRLAVRRESRARVSRAAYLALRAIAGLEINTDFEALVRGHRADSPARGAWRVLLARDEFLV